MLPGSERLQLSEPLDVRMVDGINTFALREIERAALRRQKRQRDFSSVKAYESRLANSRQRFREIIGAGDARETADGFQIEATVANVESASIAIAESDDCQMFAVRWRVLDGVTGEGLLLRPRGRDPVAHVVAVPDADWSPDMFVGRDGSNKANDVVLKLVGQGCEVLVPRLINRDSEHSGHPDVRYTNLTHREYVYRTSFQVGRHIIGYEVQKILAAVDRFAATNRPVGVLGVGEGGLLAMYSSAIDTRIQSTLVCGYFDRRDQVWTEPIYRNVWGLLTEFGDADIAGMVAPRILTIEACRIPEIEGPPKAKKGQRNSAAPGSITTPELDQLTEEFKLAKTFYESLGKENELRLVTDNGGTGTPCGDEATAKFADGLGIATSFVRVAELEQTNPLPDESARQKQQITELVNFSQALVRRSAHVRDAAWQNADRSSVDAWKNTTESFRDKFYDTVIGRLPDPTMPMNPRSRLVASEEAFDTYEVMLDVYSDVIAGGLLLLPNDMKPREKRPVVVCQHGLEGTPQWTLEPHKGGFHDRGFSAELAERGFIVYAPQNPYRGGDRFRSIQRKSNPLKRSLFSYIIPQHRRTLQWLATLPNVDSQRIAFYGISYGGKTAMRVPTMLPEYALSICSADFNEWIVKTTSVTHRTSYVFTGEYEIWEWNMAHVANYAELANLMAPRPFMVERGHRDGVAPDEWVAWEYAKVRRHYDELGIGDKTEIEFFNGPHTIRGSGTFEFLHRHLNWPRRE